MDYRKSGRRSRHFIRILQIVNRQEIDLTDEDMTQIYKWFDEAEPNSWDKAQDSNRELWHMGLEYKDGTIATYTLIEDDGKTPLSVLKVNLWNLVDAGHLTGVKK